MTDTTAGITLNVPKLPELPPDLPKSVEKPKPILPPVLDPSRKAEVKSITVQTVGSILISAIVLFGILMNRGAFDFYFFIVLLAIESKDPLINFIKYLTGAKAASLETKIKQKEDEKEVAKEKWEDEKEQMRFKFTESEIEKAKLRAEIDWGKRMQEELKKLFLQNGTP